MGVEKETVANDMAYLIGVVIVVGCVIAAVIAWRVSKID
jgi:hypothetical protein